MVDINLRLLNGLPISIDKIRDAIRQYQQTGSTVESAFQQAHLYFIGSIPKANFNNFIRSSNVIKFDWISSTNSIPVTLSIPPGATQFQQGPNFVGWQVQGLPPTIITPSTIPFDLMIMGGMPIRPVINLDYIGKAISQVAFERLILNPHKRLAEILMDNVANDLAGHDGTEILILMFEVSNQDGIPLHAAVSEVEMALINYFRPPYNKIQYKTYPKNSSSNLEQYQELKITIQPTISLKTNIRSTTRPVRAIYGDPQVFQ